jgi:hypothetical protein
MIDLNTRKDGGRLAALIDEAIVAERGKDTPREYLGASELGKECARSLQYSYFKAPKDPGKDFDGRLFRIFHRGHAGEEWMIRWLRAAGFDLRTEKPDGKQFGFSVLGGRVKGHCDGVFVDGPEGFAPWPRLWECKVLGAKGWAKLHKDGLRKAYPVYYGQVSIYQAYLRLEENPAVFTALNADSMDIYTEYVPFDCEEAQRLSDLAVRILQACDCGELLPRISSDPSFYICSWCSWKARCHYDS